jgi:4-aminobutyrate aminotransferase-like enzyme
VYLRGRLEELKGKHEIIGDVRGTGAVAGPRAGQGSQRQGRNVRQRHTNFAAMNIARTDVDQFVELRSQHA